MQRRIKRAIMSTLTAIWVVGIASLPVTEFPSLEQTEAKAAERDQSSKLTTGESWQVIYTNDQRIGYSRSNTKMEDRNEKKVVVTEHEEHLQFKRFGQSIRVAMHLQTEETVQGEMLGYTFELKNPPATTMKSVGTVKGQWLEIETTIAGRKQKRTMAWDPEVKSPAYQDRLLQEHGLKPGDKYSFKTFLPELNITTTVRIQADDYRTVKLHNGQSRRLLKTRITTTMPPITARAYIDEDGEALRTETELLGTEMIVYTVPEEVAMEELAGAELDLAVATLVRVDAIKNAHQTQKVVYRIKTPDADPIEHLPVGSTQQVKRVNSETAEVTVTAADTPRSARRVAVDPEFLQPSQYLQCRDQRVAEHARRAAGTDVDPLKIALRMERYVRDRLTKKNFSTAMASAAEVAENLEGDCTEHAVLLAAMLRAKRIPSRLAVGMVYIQSQSAFGGHMWTEAFLGGEWYPLDATLGRGGIGAAHIKLAESSFSDDGPTPVCTFLPLINILGKMEIEIVDVE